MVRDGLRAVKSWLYILANFRTPGMSFGVERDRSIAFERKKAQHQTMYLCLLFARTNLLSPYIYKLPYRYTVVGGRLADLDIDCIWPKINLERKEKQRYNGLVVAIQGLG